MHDTRSALFNVLVPYLVILFFNYLIFLIMQNYLHNIARDAFLFRIGEAFIEFFLITGTSIERKNVQTKTVTIFLLRCKMHDFALSWWPTTASFNLLSWSQYFPKFMVEKRAHSRLSNRHQMDRRTFFEWKIQVSLKKHLFRVAGKGNRRDGLCQ